MLTTIYCVVSADWGSCLISDDELVTAPVLITSIRKVPADDDGDLSAPVERNEQNSPKDDRNHRKNIDLLFK